MDITNSNTVATLDITNRTDVLRFTKCFSEFRACDRDLWHKEKLKNLLFIIRVAHDQKRTTLYLTVERGGTGNAGQPAAMVILWYQLSNGTFEEYCSGPCIPLKKTEDPDVVIMIKNLFKKDG